MSCRTVACSASTGSGISHTPLALSIEPTCISGTSTSGKPFGSNTAVARRWGWKLRPDRVSTLATGHSEQVDQHLPVWATPDSPGDLVDEVLGPMSHPGSIRVQWAAETPIELERNRLNRCADLPERPTKGPVGGLTSS